jgi:16S rRNA (guanine966-N2)-methyltransferase
MVVRCTRSRNDAESGMRIISGTLGGRIFDSPGTQETHPMSEKIRGALFNVLGDINGLNVLDVYAGSGAVSFEATSRGAAGAIAIETSHKAQSVIEKNIKSLGLNDRVKLIGTSAEAWLDNSTDEKFDLIICDPPFDDIHADTLIRLAAHLKTSGLLSTSWPTKLALLDISGRQLVKSSSYGNARLVFYR